MIKILIYGRSGYGKSTLLEIISGFHNLNNNDKLLVNGNDNKNTYNNLKKNLLLTSNSFNLRWDYS